jgi:hypothetical protein
MIESTIDLMYIALTVSILVFTIFLCWMMYYAVQILRQGNEVISDIRQKLAEFEEALANIKDKVMTSAASISLVTSQLGTVIDLVKGRKKKSTKK